MTGFCSFFKESNWLLLELIVLGFKETFSLAPEALRQDFNMQPFNVGLR